MKRRFAGGSTSVPGEGTGDPGGSGSMRWQLRGWRIEGLGKLRQNRRGVHATRKITHEILHFALPMPVKTKIVHFVQRLRGRPMFESHPVRSDEHSRAV